MNVRFARYLHHALLRTLTAAYRALEQNRHLALAHVRLDGCQEGRRCSRALLLHYRRTSGLCNTKGLFSV